ncbi:hypothetical protein [Streptomyces halobius]|uniref:Uncharacterized protein n=1 Tax=Streptomyces halobius TaxID=2879846 RepID=A0ABY4MM78_9ACTN|nr:hypothetical protein [Streptomyces halobius]UQA98173.1 hypothetical protein K9S39_06170 [Streptomyces halobius]
MPFSSCSRPMLATTLLERSEAESGMNGSGFGMKPTLSIPRWGVGPAVADPGRGCRRAVGGEVRRRLASLRPPQDPLAAEHRHELGAVPPRGLTLTDPQPAMAAGRYP